MVAHFCLNTLSVDIQLTWLPHCKDNKSKAFFQIFFELFLVVLIFLTRVLKVLISLEFDEKCIIFDVGFQAQTARGSTTACGGVK